MKNKPTPLPPTKVKNLNKKLTNNKKVKKLKPIPPHPF